MPRHVIGGLVPVDARSQPPRRFLALEVRQEERGDELEHPVLLDRDERDQPAGLGHEHLLQDGVIQH